MRSRVVTLTDHADLFVPGMIEMKEGTCSNMPMPHLAIGTEYFVLDTRTSGAAYYPGQAAWEAALAAAGVSEIDLRAYRVLQRPGPRAGADRTRGGHPDRDPLGVLAKSTISRMRMPTHEHARAMPAERHPLSSRSR